MHKARAVQGSRAIDTAISAGVVSFLLLLWYFLTPRLVSELVFPSPQSVWEAMQSIGPRLLTDSMVTLARVVAGWGIGVILGIVTGLLMTWSRAFRSLVNPLIEAVRPIPPVALIPFFIIWFGLGAGGQIGLVALACFMVLTVNTFVSVHNVAPIFVRAAASLGAGKATIYRTIIVPAILPSLVS